MSGKITAGLAVLGAALVLMPAGARAHMRTETTIFHAYTAGGMPTITTRPARGYCWTGALTIDRNDAWRCFVGNFIYDPCFSSQLDPGHVICPNAALTGGIRIHLTKRLPYQFANRRAPSLRDPPWDIQSASGRHYIFASGATKVVDHKRANYFCAGCSGVLWELPDRRVQPWTIPWALITATSLHQLVTIRHAWM